MAMQKMSGSSKPMAKMAGKAKRPQASAGKSNPKAALKGKGSLPKVTTKNEAKPRKLINKAAVAQGNENARELYNAYRGSKNFVPGAARAKVTKAEAAKGGTKYGVPMDAVRKTQRSGGKGR